MATTKLDQNYTRSRTVDKWIAGLRISVYTKQKDHF